jgi:hypothetical protein
MAKYGKNSAGTTADLLIAGKNPNMKTDFIFILTIILFSDRVRV